MKIIIQHDQVVEEDAEGFEATTDQGDDDKCKQSRAVASDGESSVQESKSSSQTSSNQEQTKASNKGGTGAVSLKRKHSATRNQTSTFEELLKQKKGLEIRRVSGDGNCLFRSISVQIYGDDEWHGEIRKRIVDYMEKESSHFSHFVTGDFRMYIRRMREDGCFGNNPEIQAAAEVYNRAVEVYKDWTQEDSASSSSSSSSSGVANSLLSRSVEPINIFQSSYQGGDYPIRLAYRNGNHYDAVIHPYEASVGVGLGMPGLKPGDAEKSLVAKAFEQSKSTAHSLDQYYMEKTRILSDREATEMALEEAAIAASLREHWRTQSQSSKNPFKRHKKDPSVAAAAAASSSSFLTPKATSRDTSSYSGKTRRRKTKVFDASTGTVTSSPCPTPGLSGSSSSSSSSSRGMLDSSSNFKSLKQTSMIAAGFASSSTSFTSSSSSSSATAKAAATSSSSCSHPTTWSGVQDDLGIYPPHVEELVLNGFPLQDVIQAHSIVGDNFDDMLAYLLRCSNHSRK